MDDISKLVLPEFYTDADRFIEKMKQNKASVEDFANTIYALNSKSKVIEVELKLNSTGGDFNTIVKLIEQLRVANEQLTRAYSEMGKAAVENEKIKQAQIKTARDEIKLAKDLEDQQRRNERSTKDLSNAYVALKAEYKLAADEAKRLGAEFGINDQRFKDAAASAAVLNTKLLEIEKSVGQNQRNVGNYNSVMVSFGQIMKESTNIANGWRTYLMAIGNNVTQFSDAISDARRKGQSWKEILGDLGKSFFSLTGAITIAFTAGQLLYNWISQQETAASKAEKANKKYAESIKSIEESSRNASFEEIARVQVLTAVAKDEEQSMKNRMRAVDELQKKYPDYFGNLTKEAILNGNVTAEVKELTKALLAKAAAQAAEKKVAAAAEVTYGITLAIRKEQDALNKSTAQFNELSAVGSKNQYAVNNAVKLADAMQKSRIAIAGYNEDLKKAQKEQEAFATDAVNFGKQAGQTLFGPDPKAPKGRTPRTPNDPTLQNEKNYTKEIADELNARARLEIENQKVIANNEENSLQDRLEAYQRIKDLEREIATNTADAEINSANLALNKIADYERIDIKKRTDQQKNEIAKKENYNQQIITANAKMNAEIGKADREEIEGITKIYEQYVKFRLDQIQAIETNTAAQEDEAQKALMASYEAGKIGWTEYNKARAATSKQYARESLKNVIDYLQEEITAASELGINTTKLQEKLNAEKKLLYKADLDEWTNNEQQKYEESKKIKEALRNLATELFTTVQSFADAAFDKEVAQSEARRKLIERDKDAKIASITATYTNEKERNEKLAEFQAEYALEQKRIDAEQLAAKRKKAAFDKAAAITQAIVSGARGVVEALPNVPLSIIVGLIAAAQIARIAATPLPQYAKGGIHKKGGLAIVGEEGHELVETPSGRKFVTPGTATVMDIPQFSKIHTADETRKIMRHQGMSGIPQFKESDATDYTNLLKRNNDLLENLPNKLNKKNYYPVPDYSWNAYLNNKIH